MRKLLSLVLVALLLGATTSVYSQHQPTLHFVAMSASFMFEGDESFSQPTPVNIPIEFNQQKREFIIYTDNIKVFSLTDDMEELNESGVRSLIVKAFDRAGKSCIIMISYTNTSNYISLFIIYSDFSVKYLIR